MAWRCTRPRLSSKICYWQHQWCKLFGPELYEPHAVCKHSSKQQCSQMPCRTACCKLCQLAAFDNEKHKTWHPCFCCSMLLFLLLVMVLHLLLLPAALLRCPPPERIIINYAVRALIELLGSGGRSLAGQPPCRPGSSHAAAAAAAAANNRNRSLGGSRNLGQGPCNHVAGCSSSSLSAMAMTSSPAPGTSFIHQTSSQQQLQEQAGDGSAEQPQQHHSPAAAESSSQHLATAASPASSPSTEVASAAQAAAAPAGYSAGEPGGSADGAVRSRLGSTAGRAADAASTGVVILPIKSIN